MATVTQFRAIDSIMENHDYSLEDEDVIEEEEIQEEYTEAEKRDMEIGMIQLLARKDLIHHDLGRLDPGSKRDCKRIAAYNIELRLIDDRIAEIEEIIGKKVTELDKGTRVGRFMGRVKRTFKSIGKSVKRFVRRHQETIESILMIGVPLVLAAIVKAVI